MRLSALCNAIAVPEPLNYAVITIEGIVTARMETTKAEKRGMPRMMLDAVYIHIASKKIVGRKPEPAIPAPVQVTSAKAGGMRWIFTK